MVINSHTWDMTYLLMGFLMITMKGERISSVEKYHAQYYNGAAA